MQPSAFTSSDRGWATTVLDACTRKIRRLAERLGPAYLNASVAGRYVAGPAWWWTSGFWPGLLLLAHRYTLDPALLGLATQAEEGLEAAFTSDQLYELHHDVGFQFLPTAVARHALTGDPVARRRGLLAATFLMSRFNPTARFLEAWNGPKTRGLMIIDTLMNLPLLAWAAQTFDAARFRQVAAAHAHTAATHIVRPDGSTRHIVRFDLETGQVVDVLGGQGHDPHSCWSRGQAWAVYGFAQAARALGNPDFRQTALRVADAFLGALPEHGLPPWDFRAPDAADGPRDTSAGAIAASGLLTLAAQMPAPEAERLRRAALDLLRHVWAGAGQGDHEALLVHATGNKPWNENVDVSLIYGDFYFYEALLKVTDVVEA